MSFFLEGPEALTAAASDVAGIGTDISSANAVAAAGTTGVEAAAGDAVSAQVAALFSSHGQGYQQISKQFAAFHDQIALGLNASANAYASTESAAAKSLASAINAPAAALLGQPLASLSGAGTAVSNAVSQIQSAFSGGVANLLALTPTGGAAAAASALLGPAAAETATAAVLPISWATTIENTYLFVEPYVQYGFELASWAVGWLPYVSILSPQIMFFYYLFEPMVQAGLFNTLDWLSGTISFAQGWSNFWSTTAASINNFIQTEIDWLFWFFPPFPPPLPTLP